MSVSPTALPEIVYFLRRGDVVDFVILPYTEFILLTSLTDVDPPEAECVLDFSGVHAFILFQFEAYRSFVTQLKFSGSIDEEMYLRYNPDIGPAIAAGQIDSATHHYIIQGYFEGRKARKSRKKPLKSLADQSLAMPIAEGTVPVQSNVEGGS